MSRALVTGATRGVGRAVAAALACAGYETCALGRDRLVLEELRSDFGVLPMAIDLTDREAVRVIVEGMKPDIVVHAALRWPNEAAFEKLQEADIDMALEVNLSAMFHLTRLVLPAMKEQGLGALFVVSPHSGESPSILERSVAGANDAFVDALQGELADVGITAQSIICEKPPFHSLVASILEHLETVGLAPLRYKADAHNHQGTRNVT
jgi:3-hydroxy acid dehydrogenase / malonic semialdehyde reductase